MPAATNGDAQSGFACLKTLEESLGELADSVGANRKDLAFLESFLKDPILESLVETHDRLEDQPTELASDDHAGKLIADVVSNIGGVVSSDENAAELEDILSDPHVKALINAYDDVADKNFEEEEPDMTQLVAPPPPMFNNVADQVRLVGIRKDPNAPLGITVKIDEHQDLVIARIMAGSMIENQGLLHVGDIVKEINGIPVSSPEQMMDIIKYAEGSITLKIVPTLQDQQIKSQKYVKANFNYDPEKDRLIPCRDAGLAFRDGDVLQILTSEDPNWWQARVVSKDTNGKTGLIPSQSLEEKRKAYVQPDYDYSKSSLLCGLKRRKKKKVKYSATKNTTEFDGCNLAIYEEVARMPPFERKCLVLVGANGVGRRSLKERILKDDPRRFGAVMPHTSRAPRDGEVHGKGYYFTDRQTMEEDIRNGLYLEFGEYNGNVYGTKLDSIQRVTETGRMCVLDVNPTSLKVLKTAEFMPFIVFVAAPSAEALKRMYEEGKRKGIIVRKGASGARTLDFKTEEDFRKVVDESAQIERVYKGLFDATIVNDSFEDAYKQLRDCLNELGTENQWVPINWVY